MVQQSSSQYDSSRSKILYLYRLEQAPQHEQMKKRVFNLYCWLKTCGTERKTSAWIKNRGNQESIESQGKQISSKVIFLR